MPKNLSRTPPELLRPFPGGARTFSTMKRRKNASMGRIIRPAEQSRPSEAQTRMSVGEIQKAEENATPAA